VFGYYIEVTKTHLTQVPAHYVRKQTVATGRRRASRGGRCLTAHGRC
jgi:DNA mismatch repair ATPase MutS